VIINIKTVTDDLICQIIKENTRHKILVIRIKDFVETHHKHIIIIMYKIKRIKYI